MAVITSIEAEFATHPRVKIADEVFRHFCGWVGWLFTYMAAPDAQTVQRRRAFARIVFDIADIGHGLLHHNGHPDRLDDLLSADVSPLPMPADEIKRVQELFLRRGVFAPEV